jgi:hypothetical protein
MKIIIKDWQFLISEGLITEEKYQDAIKKLKVGDKLEYTDDKNDNLNFEVIFNDNGQVYLKNIDSGVYKNNYFFITVSDLVKNDLTFKTINVPKNLPDNLKNEQDDSVKLSAILKQFPTNTWKKSTFKNISKLNMGNEDIDIEKNYIKVKDVNPFLEELQGLKSGNDYRFILSNGGIIDLSLIDNSGSSLFFEYSDIKGSAKSYTELIDSELLLDINSNSVQQFVSSLDDDEYVDSKYDLTFKKIISGSDDENNRTYKKIIIKNIVDIDLISKSDEKDSKEEEVTDEKDIEYMSDEEIDDASSEDITDLVLSNPTFKDTFLKKRDFSKHFPKGTKWVGSLLNLIKSKPVGILVAKKILKNFNIYGDSEENSVIDFFEGENNKKRFIQLLGKSFNKKGISLDITKKYEVKVNIKKNNKGGVSVSLYGDGFMFKINKVYDYSNGEFRATLIINYNTDDEYRENRTIRVIDNK